MIEKKTRKKTRPLSLCQSQNPPKKKIEDENILLCQCAPHESKNENRKVRSGLSHEERPPEKVAEGQASQIAPSASRAWKIFCLARLRGALLTFLLLLLSFLFSTPTQRSKRKIDRRKRKDRRAAVRGEQGGGERVKRERE